MGRVSSTRFSYPARFLVYKQFLGARRFLMKRRDALVAIAAAAAALRWTPERIQTLQHAELTDQEVEALLRALAEVEPRPGETERVRAFLSERTGGARTEVTVQPGFAFDPEVEP
jgi:hypothetical protein